MDFSSFCAWRRNTAADEETKKENLDTEWNLNPDILAQALDIIGIKPEVDMFASRLYAQFPVNGMVNSEL